MSTGVDRGGAGPHPAPPQPGFPRARHEPHARPIPPPTPLYPPRYEAPEYEAPQYETSRYETPYDAPPYETPYESSQYDAPPYESPQARSAAPYATSPHAAPRPRRPVTAAVCMVLGLGLLAGAAAGAVINHGSAADEPTAAEASASAYTATRALWHSTPVDSLFPRTVKGRAAGPGGADRTWTRVGVAPADGCADAFDPLLATMLDQVGCARLLRATYTDATSTDVTTVGILVTKADAAAMRALHNRWNNEHLGSRADLMPRPVAFAGTAASGFGDKQRATWAVDVSADLPVVVYAVSGFADGREIDAPQPAASATADGATSAPAQSGLGNAAEALSDAVDARVRKAAKALTPSTGSEPAR